MRLQEIADTMTVVENFRGEGVNFFDINTTLMNSDANKSITKWLIRILKDLEFDMLAGVDARGFLFKSVADEMGIPFTMIRKSGKLPNCVLSTPYSTEYSSGDILSISDRIEPGTKILLVDDVIVTGGTLLNAADLIWKIGCVNVGCLALVEVVNHPRRVRLFNDIDCFSLFKYDEAAKTTHLDPELNKKYLTMERHDSYSMKRFYQLKHDNNDYDTVVMYYPTMQGVAENFVSRNLHSRLGSIIWDKFKDGTDNITFEHEDYLRDKNLIFFMSLVDGDIFGQISMMKVLPRQDITSLHVYLPFFPSGTMERVSEYGPNTLATADTLSSMLSTDIPMTKTGPAKITIYDLHTLQNRFYFRNDVMIEMATGVEILKKKLSKDTLIVFPDAGAKSRFGEFFNDGYHVVACNKVRRGDERVITCDDIDLLPRKVKINKAIIIDDLVQSGGTLIECMRSLRRKGIENVSAYVTHLVLPDKAHLKFIGRLPDDSFDHIYHTNSNPTVVKRVHDDCLRLRINNPFVCLNFEEYITQDQISNKDKKFINIAVASLSDVKLGAVYDSFSRYFNCRVFGVSGIQSGVPEQPIGNEEISLGCLNRMNEMKSYLEKSDFIFVSIESGIRKMIKGDVEVSVDYTEILCSGRNGGEFSLISDDVVFPNGYFEESSNTGKTVGELMKRDYGYDSTSWNHNYGDGKTRRQLISDSISDFLSQKSKLL